MAEPTTRTPSVQPTTAARESVTRDVQPVDAGVGLGSDVWTMWRRSR
jgi:hypothetical protein